jgi:YggT family protein
MHALLDVLLLLVVLQLYVYVIIAAAILSWLVAFKIAKRPVQALLYDHPCFFFIVACPPLNSRSNHTT